MLIETHLEQLKKISIMVATPMYGAMCSGAFADSLASLRQLAGRYKLSVQFTYIGNESLITRARNRLAHEYLKKSDCTHLMFIDADIGFNPVDVFTLAIQAKVGSDKAVVCGPYPMKGINWGKVKTAVESGAADTDPEKLAALGLSFPFDIGVGPAKDFKINELNEVRYAGTGFMMIQRQVFVDLSESLNDRTYIDPQIGKDGKGEKVTAFFDCEIDDQTNTYLSEDYVFCIRAREAGHKIWLCPWVQLAHVGTQVFKGGIADFAEAGMPIHSK